VNFLVGSALPPGLVAVLSLDTTRYCDFAISYGRLRVPAGTGEFWSKGAEITQGRNEAVRVLLEHPELEWLWFLDDDHKFVPEVLTTLLTTLLSTNLDVVSPLVVNRKPPFRVFGQHWVRDEDLVVWGDLDPRELPASGVYHGSPREHLGLATAGMLIRRHVVEKLSSPWFECGKIDSEFIMDDLYFSVKATEAGFRLGLDCSVVLNHITPMSLVCKRYPDEWGLDLDVDGKLTRLPWP
jgi:hypothetical protein